MTMMDDFFQEVRKAESIEELAKCNEGVRIHTGSEEEQRICTGEEAHILIRRLLELLVKRK